MLKIGITGGIGSGKSTVANVFHVLGIPVYDADSAAKKLMNENKELQSEIIRLFGQESYSTEGLNRTYLSSTVFNDPVKLDQLNKLVHPLTIADAEQWMQQQTTPYAIKEAALIFESGAQVHLDKVIGVYAPQDLRIQRAMQRDGITKEKVLARMDRQMDEEKKMRLCDYVIVNDEEKALIPQVLALHEQFLVFSL